MNNILLITQEYPADDVPKEFTPVVHYFTKEWVKLGYTVKVINCPSNFPAIYYKVCRPFKRRIESCLGTNIRMYTLQYQEYNIEGVSVCRIPLKKLKPHGRYSKGQIKKAVDSVIRFCDVDDFIPDVIIGHWVNPSLEIMQKLKCWYHVPACLVMHDFGLDFLSIYKKEYQKMLADIDIIGYRSDAIKREFERKFGIMNKWFYCHSGVPHEFIEHLHDSGKSFQRIRSFIFVGLLLKRKHPNELLKALMNSTVDDFQLKIIGEGDEYKTIEQTLQENSRYIHQVHLLGRVSREEVKKHLYESDVFVMISENETFGLVYIEAMAAGCITIASRNEGFDGIIKDGYNGFLCEAGNVEELSYIINKINNMLSEQIAQISARARATAREMTDLKVALNYIRSIESLI